MLSRWAFRAAALATVVLAALAGATAWWENGWLSGTHGPPAATTDDPPGAGLCIDSTDRDLGEVPVGVHPVEFVITNRSATEQRILGARGECGLTCCFTAADEGPAVTVGARESYVLCCTVRVIKAGPFDGTLILFVDRGGTREIRLTVRGVSTDSSKGSSDAANTSAAIP